jgi:two-component system NtrC family sensor kinase
MLKDGRIPPGREEEFRGYLSHVSTETARVGRIVSELLAFSRRGSPRRAPSDLHVVIERTLSILRHKLEMARVEARFEPGGAMPLVECDASQVEQVVMNLIVNAAEALPPGGHVVVRTRHDPVAVEMVIEVEDDGPGIAEHHLAHIFEPFYSTKEGGKSLGLGLSVVFGIVDSHHGRIEVRSRPGHGTLFRVRLPVRPPAEPAPPPQSPRPGAAAGGAP